jgi:hypothetical protein
MKVQGFISGCHRYRLHVVLQSGFKFCHTVFACTQAELDHEAKFVIKDRGYWEEVERVYATRIDCPAVPERVRRAA